MNKQSKENSSPEKRFRDEVPHSSKSINKNIMNQKSFNVEATQIKVTNTDFQDLKNFITNIVESKCREFKEIIISQNRIITENSGLLTKLVGVEKDLDGTISKFPIETMDQLEQLENSLKEIEIFNRHVKAFKRMLHRENLQKCFKNILSLELILTFNYDGIHGKRKFKEFNNINAALFGALKTDQYNDELYVKDIRSAFRRVKNAHFKKVCITKGTTN